MMLMMTITIVPYIGEVTISFLFVRSVFQWDVKEYSQYSSIVSSVALAGKQKFDNGNQFFIWKINPIILFLL